MIKYLLKHVRFGKKFRLVFHKSNKNIYLQLMDDNLGSVVCASSTLEIKKSNVSSNKEDLTEKNMVNSYYAERVSILLAAKILSNNNLNNRCMVFDIRRFRFGKISKIIIDTLRAKKINI